MSTFFKKSVKLSLAAAATLKLSDSLYNPDSRMREHFLRFWNQRSLATADDKDSKKSDFMLTSAKDDLVARLLQDEFTGDISKVPKVNRVKFDFDLK